MNSIRIKKLGKILIGTALLFLPYFIGKISFILLLGESFSNVSGIPAYLLGLGISILLFFIVWILRAIVLWFLDDRGMGNYW